MTSQCWNDGVGSIRGAGHAQHAVPMIAAGHGDAGNDGQPRAERGSLGGLRILLVEDSWHVAQAYKSLLEMVGFTVAGPAATIAEAKELFAGKTPDIAVVDINLRGEMAYDLIDQLIASDVPTVVVSGYEVLPCLPGRVAAVLTKPVRASLLLATIRTIIAQRSTQ